MHAPRRNGDGDATAILSMPAAHNACGCQQLHLRHDQRSVLANDSYRQVYHHRRLRQYRPPVRFGESGRWRATYVARGSVYHAMQTKNYIKHAIEHKGFSVVECLSTCPTYYGRRNKIGDAVSMMERLRDDCTMLKPGVTEYDKPFVIGEFVNKEAKEYTEAYDEVIMKAGGKK